MIWHAIASRFTYIHFVYQRYMSIIEFKEALKYVRQMKAVFFADYAGILEKLREQPSSFGHRSVFVNSPLKEETYKQLLERADWLMILDENLKSWDVSLRSASEKLYYKSSDQRSIGIYSKTAVNLFLGYNQLIASLGNYIPSLEGVKEIIEAIRNINDDGLLSIASHSTNSIFDRSHGKGSLGLALAALNYKQSFPDALLVGLDSQLAREWLSDRRMVDYQI